MSSYDVALARRLKRLSRAGKDPGWRELRCEATNPLTFASGDGSLLFTADTGMVLTAAAASRTWQTGDRAAVLLAGSGALVLDKIGG